MRVWWEKGEEKKIKNNIKNNKYYYNIFTTNFK